MEELFLIAMGSGVVSCVDAGRCLFFVRTIGDSRGCCGVLIRLFNFMCYAELRFGIVYRRFYLNWTCQAYPGLSLLN